MRLFIAIDFDDKSYFKEMQDQIPTDTAKLNLTGSYHLTLKFLGEVEDNKADMIKERLGKIKVEPFSVSTGRVGFFHSERLITKCMVVGHKGKKHKLTSGSCTGIIYQRDGYEQDQQRNQSSYSG